MPILNFKPQFVEPIRSGRKHHTIRAKRAIPVKVGDKLYLYTGLRHKGAYRILPEPVKCTKVQDIAIHQWTVRIDHEIIFADECEMLAVADGFENFSEMMKFWEGRLPFEGDIIHWELPEASTEVLVACTNRVDDFDAITAGLPTFPPGSNMDQPVKRRPKEVR